MKPIQTLTFQVQETNFRGDVLAVELARVEAAVRRLNCRSLIFDLLETYLSVLDRKCPLVTERPAAGSQLVLALDRGENLKLRLYF